MLFQLLNIRTGVMRPEKAQSLVRWGKWAQLWGLLGCVLGVVLYGVTIGSSGDPDSVVQAYMVGLFQGVSLGLVALGFVIRITFSLMLAGSPR